MRYLAARIWLSKCWLFYLGRSGLSGSVKSFTLKVGSEQEEGREQRVQQEPGRRDDAFRHRGLFEHDMYHLLTFIKYDPPPAHGEESRWFIIG